MNLIILTALIGANGQSCQSNEFWFSNSSCEPCSSYIDHCTSCDSGNWSPVTNGSFESPAVPAHLNEKRYDSVPGWTSDEKIEIRKRYSAYEGIQYLDTANLSNQNISQTITTEANHYYILEFAYSPRPGYSISTMNTTISWNSEIVLAFAEEGNGLGSTVWTHYSTIVKASSSSSTINFESVSPDDNGQSMLVDDVKITDFPSCLSCETGYSVSQSDNSCILCPSSCEECEKQALNIVCNLCADMFYVLNGGCSSCVSYCKKCQDSVSCTECLGTFELTNDLCQCPEYYLLNLSTETCYYFPLRANLTFFQDYYILTFSEDLNSDLTIQNVRSFFIPSNTTFEFTVSKLSSKEYKLEIEQDTIDKGSTGLGLEISNVKGINGSDLLDKYFEVNFPVQDQSTQPDEVSEEESDDEEQETEIFFGMNAKISAILGILLLLVSSLVLSLISMNSNALWSFLSISVMIYFLPVQNTRMPLALKQICKEFDSDLFGLVPNFGEYLSLKEDSYQRSSENWGNYDIRTDSFFLNAGNIISIIIFSLLFFPISLFFLRCIFRKHLWVSNRVKDLRWNFFLRLSLQSFIELTAIGILSSKPVTNKQIFNQGINIERIVSAICLLLSLCLYIWCVYLVIKYRENNEKLIRNYSSYFEEFKSGSLRYLLFYPLFYTRRLAYAIGMNLLMDYPLEQVIMNVLFCVLVTLYIFVLRPYKRGLDNILNCLSESVLLVYFVISALCLTDLSKDQELLSGRIMISAILLIFAANLASIVYLIAYSSCSKRKTREVNPEESSEVEIIRSYMKKNTNINILNQDYIDNSANESRLFRQRPSTRNTIKDNFNIILEANGNRSFTEDAASVRNRTNTNDARRHPINLNTILGHRRIDSNEWDY